MQHRDLVIRNAVDYLMRQALADNSDFGHKRGAQALFMQQAPGHAEWINDPKNLNRLKEGIAKAEQGDLSTAKELLKSLETFNSGIYKAHSWGKHLESHHPISLGSTYLLGHDLSTQDAQRMYSTLTDMAGLPIGNPAGTALTYSDPGHQMAHMDPVTFKPAGTKGFQTLVKPLVEQFKDPFVRALAYKPLGEQERDLSNLAYNLRPEREARRFAGERIASILPDFRFNQLDSTEIYPRYMEAFGFKKKGTNPRSYAQTAYHTLTDEDVQNAVKFGWRGQSYDELGEALQEAYLRHGGLIRPMAQANTGMPKLKQLLSQLRPGQLELLSEVPNL